MSVNKRAKRGRIEVSLGAVANLAANAALECYGVVGMASKKPIRDGLAELLNSENYNKGVFAYKKKNGIQIDMYIIVAYGVKITEVVTEVQKKIRYVLRKTLDCDFKAINVYVQSTKKL